MYGVIIILAPLLFATGLYYLLSGVLKLPTAAEERAAIKIRGMGIEKTDPADRLVLAFAKPISKIVSLEPFTQRRLAATLRAAEIGYTPEMYIAISIASSFPVLLLAVPAYVFMPPVIVIVLIATGLQITHNYDRAARAAKRNRDAIEDELPRFMCQITEQLTRSRDIRGILNSYRRTAGPPLAKQLRITVADMDSGSMDKALERFDARVGSPLLSNIVRGLLGVLRGDTGLPYFEQLSRDFRQIEISRLKKEAGTRPGVIRRYSMLMLGCFLAMFFVIFAVQIVEKLSNMF
jgi:Flp pilus assembly protein TadB